ncbi:HNH endonuclease signature motif containing protein [Geobacillus thermodenitrificans]|uniref:HNH endonuclease n=1 Tax=Geobacillus thermodenitrificans TaxID=33940 RepID=UPI002E1C2A8B|nr:HNH endonuclease signature motif containing protein [Geobacillus thermodenitrificans]
MNDISQLKHLFAGEEALFEEYVAFIEGTGDLSNWEKSKINKCLRKIGRQHCWICNTLKTTDDFNRASQCKKCIRELSRKNYKYNVGSKNDTRQVEPVEYEFRYKDVVKRWRQLNRRAEEFGLPAFMTAHNTEIMLNHFLNEDGYICCAYCNEVLKTSEEVHLDHFVPIALGIKGSTEDNVVPCCKTCNLIKRDLTFVEWITQMEKVLGASVNKDKFGKLETYMARYNINVYEEIRFIKDEEAI